jgi:hypothetical protein
MNNWFEQHLVDSTGPYNSGIPLWYRRTCRRVQSNYRFKEHELSAKRAARKGKQSQKDLPTPNLRNPNRNPFFFRQGSSNTTELCTAFTEKHLTRSFDIWLDHADEE